MKKGGWNTQNTAFQPYTLLGRAAARPHTIAFCELPLGKIALGRAAARRILLPSVGCLCEEMATGRTGHFPATPLLVAGSSRKTQLSKSPTFAALVTSH